MNTDFEDVVKWLYEWFAVKSKQFLWHGKHKLPERCDKCTKTDGIFKKKIIIISLANYVFPLPKKTYAYTWYILNRNAANNVL